jgi:glucose/arabinose dehydrogenase
MKNLRTFFTCITALLPSLSNAQSNPLPLKPGITINRILTVQDGSIRVIKDPISGNLFYSTTDGRIYEVHQPASAAAYDSLVFTSADHHVTYAQGFTVYDSTFYVSGNDSSNTPLTFGIIVRGVLQPNGTRTWSTVMQTDFYQTADYFDHLFSGIAVTPSGDSIVICSGARGDHGEVETRYGLYPNLRNVPLTSNLYIVPAHDTNVVVLHNDTVWNDTTDLLYARGVRNTFDMAYDSQGRLFGVENSGDRDHNEEMNWLRKGHHYGYPWVMGDTDNPQQFPGFIPANDALISHYSRSWRIGAWSNDPTFPPATATFDSPIQNFGPDADKYRDETTGTVMDASDSSISMGSFTAHRSPLGLVFDNDSVMHPAYRGDAFMLSWTKGLDSCGCTAIPDTGIGPFVDASQDLIHLDLQYDSLTDNFSLHATRIVEEFEHPVDDAIDSNKIFVLENGYGGTSGLYEVIMPYIPVCAPAYTVDVNYFSCDSSGVVASINASGYPPFVYTWMDSVGTIIKTDSISDATDSISGLASGNYSVIISDSFSCTLSLPFIIAAPIAMTLALYNLCSSGYAYAIAEVNGIPPFTYEWRENDSTGNIIQLHDTSLAVDTLQNILPGNYFVTITDSLGCSSSQSFNIFQPIQLTIDTVVEAHCIGCTDGYMSFTAEPNLVSAQLIPSVGNQAGNTFINLPAGAYYICVTDSFGCSACDTFTVYENEELVPSISGKNNLLISPIPADEHLIVQVFKNASSITAILYNITGEKIVGKETESESLTIDTSGLPDGVYMLKILSKDIEEIRKVLINHH